MTVRYEPGRMELESAALCSVSLRASGLPRTGSFELTLAPDQASDQLAEGTALWVVSPLGTAVLGRIQSVHVGEPGSIGLSYLDRRSLRLPTGEQVSLVPVEPAQLRQLVLRVGYERRLASQKFESQLRHALAHDSEVLATGRVVQVLGNHGATVCVVEVVTCEPEVGVIGPDALLDLVYVNQLELASGATYDTVGGLDEQIRELRQCAFAPLHAPQLYRQVGTTPPRGIILHGPPGTGKTHLARATAFELGVHCITVSGPELVGTRYGETEASLRKLFIEAMEAAPAIIIIDEIDAIAPRRGASGAQADARIVTQILSLLDGIVALEGVIVLATTNRIEAVDPALRRPGRLDREIFVGPPNEEARRSIIEIHARPMPLTADARAQLGVLARKTPGFVGADLMALCREAGLAAIERHLATSRDGLPQLAGEVEVRTHDFEAALRLVQPTGMRNAIARSVAPTWGSVWGRHELKDRLLAWARQSLDPESPLHGEGILLSGPPGSGKTVLAEGVAGELNANLIRLRGSDVFTKWLGESEEAIRETFELARNLAPAVVFLDHLDSLAPRRGGERPEQASQRVLGELLVELDERRAEPIVILAATSAVGLVDPSVIRPGRLGLHLEAGELTDRDRSAIVAGYLDVLAGAALDGAVLAGVVADTAGWSPAELALLTRLAVATTADEPRRAAGDLGRRLNELIDDQMWRWAPVAERE